MTSLIAKLRRRMRLLARRGTVEREMDDEMRFHLEMEAADLEHRHRLQPDEARRRAVREFGGVERYKDEARDERGGRWIDDARQDARYALRVLGRARSYTAVAVLTLALGIGANTAIFSVVRGVLLRPLPYADPDRLMQVSSEFRGGRTSVSARDFLDWRTDARSFSGMAAYFTSTTNLTGLGEPERLDQARVSDNLFDILGVRPQLGRFFVRGEDDEAAPRLAVLSDGFWRRRFGADSGIVSRVIALDDQPTRIIGVAPPNIDFPGDVDLWLTTRFGARDVSPSARGARWLDVVARLAPSATLATARAEMTAIAARLSREDPRHNTGFGARLVPLREELVGSVRRPLFILLGAVGFVLLIACVNVASLSLGRTAARETELAVRTALGAGRARITRQLLTESLILSLAGGIAGVLLAGLGIRALVALAPADLPRLEAVRLDSTVLAFALALTVASGALFGLVPALQGSLATLGDRLRAGPRGGTGRAGQSRLRRVLVATEVALAIVLLAGAGLLLRSFARLRDVDPGFRATGISTFSITLSPLRYPDEDRRRVFATSLLTRLRALPGVASAALSFGLPLSGGSFGLTFEIDGRSAISGPNEPRAQIRNASTDYFRTLGIPIVRGRGFTDDDRASSRPVVLVSEATARRFWPNEDPIGQVVRTGWRQGGRQLGGEIVGIVGDVRQFSLTQQQPTGHLYVPFAQWPLDELSVVIRSGGESATVLTAARGVVRELDAELPVYNAYPLDQLVAQSVAERRFYAMTLAAFAAAAMALAAVGIYGVIAYSVQQRSRELGIRLALGASRERVVAMVLRQAVLLVAAGTAVGLLAAAALSRVLQGLLFEVNLRDPLTFTVVPLILGAVAMLACVLPARRAMAVDPASAIRAAE